MLPEHWGMQLWPQPYSAVDLLALCILVLNVMHCALFRSICLCQCVADAVPH